MASSTAQQPSDTVNERSTSTEPATSARVGDHHDGPGESGGANRDPLSAAIMPPSYNEEPAPPKPPRPLSPQQQAEATLKEAFPSIDGSVIKAVLIASGGSIEPAFNALLGMSDPDALKEPAPPAQPPRPSRTPLASDVGTSTPKNQLEADELYARQLAEHYSGSASQPYHPSGSGARRGPPVVQRRPETGLKPNELHEEEHSFLDDDLPVIKENIKRTFFETQSKVNKWVSDLKKKIDGDDDDEDVVQPPAQRYHPGISQQSYGTRRSGELGRRSGDRDRYDADPRVLGDDLTGLELRDDESPPPRPPRPLANPDLFKSTASTPAAGSRKVSFQAGPPEDIRAASPAHPDRKPSPGGRQSKWEPLSTVDPSPMTDNDPFSLGDSDDERETKTKDVKTGDKARQLPAASEVVADSVDNESQAKADAPAKSA